MTRTDVAIIGGGFSGTMVAAHLALHLDDGDSVTLFEPDAVGPGAAYGTRHREHLLNTRAAAMSAFGAEPDHFVRWLGWRGKPQQFLSRQLYGEYLSDIAQRAFERPGFTHVRDAVLQIRPQAGGGFAITTCRGVGVEAEFVVLATGTPLPSDIFLPLSLTLHPGYIADPWRFDYRAVDGPVLLIGSGLTALDALVALEASGHRGDVHVVSRNGRFPQTHADEPQRYDAVPAFDAASARALLRSFRSHVASAQKRGFDWRAVVDAARPDSEMQWRRLPEAEKRRFDRHVRTHWERIRHRAPAEVDAARQRWADFGRMHVHAGRIVNCSYGKVLVRCKDGSSIALHPDWIVNCTGIGRTHTFGLDPREHDGRLWLTGALLRGRRFEATAVPELRVIAEDVAVGVVCALRERISLTG